MKFAQLLVMIASIAGLVYLLISSDTAQLRQRFSQIDRRLIFALVGLLCLVPLVTGFTIKGIPSPRTVALYNAVQQTPPDKLVVLHINWDAGTFPENGQQTEALLHHLFRLKRHFAIVSLQSAQGPQLSQDLALKVAKEYGMQYGRDWVNWGLKTGDVAWLQSVAKNIPAALAGKDWNGTPLEQIPAMSDVKTFRDSVSLVIDITPSGSVPKWVAFVGQPHSVPIGYACTAVMAPEAYPLLDTGQLVGMMNGMAGAAQYFQLLGLYERKHLATLGMTSQAMAHFLILALIALGNVGYFAGRRSQRQEVSP